jgi:hypothetical protein
MYKIVMVIITILKVFHHNYSKMLQQSKVCEEILPWGVVTILNKFIPRSYNIFKCCYNFQQIHSKILQHIQVLKKMFHGGGVRNYVGTTLITLH